MFNRALKTFFSFLLSCNIALALATDHQTFVLNRGESISELLVQRLHIKNLYDERKILSNVLKYNQLSYAQAKKLPIGYQVQVPIQYVSLQEIQTPLEVPPIVEKTPDEVLLPDQPAGSDDFQFVALLEFYNLNGNSTRDDSSFETVGTFLTLRGLYLKEESYIWGAGLEGGITRIQGNTSHFGNKFEATVHVGLPLATNWTMTAFGGMKRDFYVNSPDGISESFIYASGPLTGIRARWRKESYAQTFLTSVSLPSRASSTVRTSFNFSAGWEGQYYWKPSQFFLAGLKYEQKNLNVYQQKMIYVNVGMGWDF